jgi:hypothetical protein
MSLALLHVPAEDFRTIRGHLLSHLPPYLNMHLREARYRNKIRVLRHLHAMYAPRDRSEIHGMISGPNVFWHYRLILEAGRSQTQILDEEASSEDAVRLRHRLLRDILNRVQMERAGLKYPPKLTPGQLYLRRHPLGTPAGDAVCRAAVLNGDLDQRFVSQLASWDLALLRR